MLKLYEFAVIKQPKLDKDGEIIDAGGVIVPIDSILAKDDAQAQLLASRAIPEKDMSDIDRIMVVVRPF